MLVWDKQLKLKWIDLRLANHSTLRQMTNLFNRCVYHQPLDDQANFLIYKLFNPLISPYAGRPLIAEHEVPG